MSDPVDATWTPPADNGGSSAEPRVLTGRYLLEERIASGGMASVWRAHDEVLARTVAVKILHDHLAADEGFRERFRREAVSAAKLGHPGVVSLYDTGSDGDHVYLVMEFVDGSTLKDLIAEQGPLSVTDVATIGEQVARALAFAHDHGLVHRDVKPANILIGADGQVKVTDFGIAKAETADDLTKAGMVLGTAAYVAPEQIRGDGVDGKTDQYALAIVLYEALTGEQPFHGDSPVATAAQRLNQDPLPVRSLRADVPRGVDAVLMRAMSREPIDRYRSCAHFADALAEYADDGGAATNLIETVADGAAGTPAVEDESFLRTEGRFLLPALVLLLLAVLLVVVGLLTGVLETRDGFPVGIARDDEGAEEPTDGEGGEVETGPLEIAGVAVFDPDGSGRERDEDLGNMLDDDPESSWRTEHYFSPTFGDLKPGVGFYVDLGGRREVAAARLVTPTPGFDVEIRVADEVPSALDGWRFVGGAEDVGEEIRVELTDAAGRYVLVWVTGELPPSPYTDDRFTAAFTDLALEEPAR
jgi:serine/threonine-protein kinase